MRFDKLELKNIGPFLDAELDFKGEGHEDYPVVLISGENGTGKSIIIDAIRCIFGNYYANQLVRDIRRHDSTSQAINLMLRDENWEYRLLFDEHSKRDKGIYATQYPKMAQLLTNIPVEVKNGKSCPNWILDYWPATYPESNGAPSSNTFAIDGFKRPNLRNVYWGTLNGSKPKVQTTQLICHLDYLRDSQDATEKQMAETLYRFLERIFEISLLDGGKLSHVARATYSPKIEQNGILVDLDQLSGGNLYLIRNLVDLLRKMFAVHVLREQPLDQLGKNPGVLLIDEAENQLHPKWQKRFLKSILELFPNLQIIATTHSPFIISSVPNARLFVCKSMIDHCVVEDVTAEYSNKPVDEILMSPLFEETQPFNEEITELLAKRKTAIEAGDQTKRAELEAELKRLNPTYFSFFEVDRLLEEVTGGAQA